MEILNGIVTLFGFIREYLGIVVGIQTIIIFYLIKKLTAIEYKYHQHDKLLFGHALIISNKLGVKTIKIHRSSDFEITQPINDISDNHISE